MLNRAFAFYQSPTFGLLDATYASKAATRWHTMKAALTIATQRASQAMPIIVETGCTREPEDWGGGMSTLIFGDYCHRWGGHVTTVDNEPKHLTRCKEITQEFAHCISYIESDSVKYLENVPTPADLLYLDSFDYPYGKLLDIYGGKRDLDAAVKALAEIPEDEIVNRYWFIIQDSQEHCLREIQAAARSGTLGERTVLLIDDNSIPGGGKARLAKQWLAENGWTLVLDAYQSLWVKA